ncbi:restriction endonuclease subunit S [Limosilactobacillus fermentum]|uniref:restriction endonuclease subunit S n=1 Tax=Limosilactobacillus fermentum TaxID=1613 RepID=UPI002F260755
MKDNQAKYPQLRFKGFTDPWEQRKLQEVLRERNNQQPQSMEYPLVSFTVENGVTPKTDRYEREQLVVGDKSSKKYKVTVLNDIVYNPANLKFGAISRNKYGNAVFSPIYITFLVNNDVTTPEFIEMFVTRNDFIKRALKYQQGTVYERQSVSPTDLLAMNVYLPGKSEQEKIGSFFQQLDETIALHQRKLDLLKEQKKGYLQKMFPQNGAKVPELRFAGFADAWVQREFGQMYKKVNEKNDLTFSKDQIISVANMYFKTDAATRSDDDYMKTYNIFRLGDIAFEGNRSKHFAYGRFVENTIGDGIVSHVFDVFRPFVDYDLTYWKYAIHNERVMGRILMTATTSSTMMTNLVAKDFLKRSMMVPELAEQKKIGELLSTLDKLIAANQRKLDLLKEQKKGFLQKMFV